MNTFDGVQTLLLLAEGEGFEPPEAFTSTVFKTAAFDRSAILPYGNIKFFSAKSSENDFVEIFVDVYKLGLPLWKLSTDATHRTRMIRIT